ncbi:cyclic nucleotide-binding domain-containing protein [Saccharothrix variisporea]|uniref:CRP-like cAMP-binding protein n=1 Tax=Saccharothrix variisporea TaxID=543527 RepID=A0A495X0K1_9PSEU|nr:cyclic nucleotide-binding domain-containing protein [Saccharothrix variisporea]RKT67482.1 CRP-like cAMP-binding protein [Saccharothrix variisporea]
MNSRVVELESVLSRTTPDRHQAQHLAVELADTLDATTARRHLDRLLRCVTALTRIGSTEAGEELLDAMLDLVEPGSDAASKVRDQRDLVAVARGRTDTAGPDVPIPHPAAPITTAANGVPITTAPIPRRPDSPTAQRPIAPSPRTAPQPTARRHDPAAGGTAQPYTRAADTGRTTAPPTQPFPRTAARHPVGHGTAGLAAIGVVPSSGTPDVLSTPAGALPLLEAEFKRATAAFGADDARTIGALVNLRSSRFQDARDRGNVEDAMIAVDDLREATDRAVTALGPHHPKSLVARSNLASAEFELARVRRAVGQTQLALPALRAAADTSFARLGPDDPHTLVAQSNLAAAELEVARVEGAHTQARRALDTIRTAAARAASVHGADHPASRLIAHQLRACETHTLDLGTSLEDVHVPVDEAARLLSRTRPAIPLTRSPVPHRVSAPYGPVNTDPQWPAASLLGRLRDHTRQELLTIGTVVRYAGERELIEQDARDTHAFLLLDGMVKVQVTDEAGDTAVLAVRVAGDLVGEMAALDHKPRSATVVTCGDVVAKLITSAELTAFMHRHNDMFVELIGVIDDQLRWANKRRRDFLSHSAAERVARVLAELVGSYGREERGGWTLGIPLTKVELASIAGMKPRTAEKAFSDLRKAGVVISHYRRDVLVPDLDHLRRFARMA